MKEREKKTETLCYETLKHSLKQSKTFSTTFNIKTIINGHGEWREKLKVKELHREPDSSTNTFNILLCSLFICFSRLARFSFVLR